MGVVDELSADGVRAHNRRETRRVLTTFAIYAAIAVAVTVGAAVTGGLLQVALIIMAVAAGVLAAWVGLFAAGAFLLTTWDERLAARRR